MGRGGGTRGHAPTSNTLISSSASSPITLREGLDIALVENVVDGYLPTG